MLLNDLKIIKIKANLTIILRYKDLVLMFKLKYKVVVD